jgi:hypothetical protein
VCSGAALFLIFVDCPARGGGFLRGDGRQRRCSVAMEEPGSAGECARAYRTSVRSSARRRVFVFSITTDKLDALVAHGDLFFGEWRVLSAQAFSKHLQRPIC